MTARRVVEKLRRDHEVEVFDCGTEPLNRPLTRYALQNRPMGAAQTYVGVTDAWAVIGYYTLVFGQVACADAPERLRKGVAAHPVPLIALARVAVATPWAAKAIRLGLNDAMLRTLQATEIAGLRALVTHAKDEEAHSFYKRFGFIPPPSDPMHLFVLLKDVRAVLGKRWPAHDCTWWAL